jgi:PAS domain S-box-containing protein
MMGWSGSTDHRGSSWRGFAVPETVIGLLLALTAAESLALLAGLGDSVFRSLLGDAMYLALDAAGIAFSVRAAQTPGMPPALRSAWYLVALGCLFNGGGDLIWTVYQVTLGEVPYPSIADVVYLGFYPLVAAGLLLIPTVHATRVARGKLIADVLMVGIAGAMITWDVILGPAAAAGEADALTNLITIGSPVGDLILLFAIARAALSMPAHGGERSLAMLTVAMAVYFVADLVYSVQQFDDAFVSGSWVDVAYTLGSLFLLVAAYLRCREPLAMRHRAAPGGRSVILPMLRAALPLMAIAGASALLLYRTAMTPLTSDGTPGSVGLLGLLVGLLVITVLVGFRSSLTVRERVVAEGQAIAGAERYRALVEQASDGIVVSDDHGRIVSANARLAELLGVPAEDLVGRDYVCLFAPGDDDAPPAQTAMEAGTMLVEERRLLRSDGTQMDAELSVRRLSDGRYQAIVRDLSARRIAEAERARMLSAIEQTAESVIVTDPGGTIVYVNPAFERVTGFPRDEALGANPRLLGSGLQPPELYRELWATLGRGETWSGEIVNRRKDGTRFRAFASISPVRDEAGAVVNFVAVERDVTREHDLEASLRQAQKMEAVGQLAGGIAHDFNNLITGIRGFAELLHDDLPDGDGRRADVDQILQASDRATELTRGLLALGRRANLAPRVIDLGELVEGIVPLLRRLVGEHIEIEVRSGPGSSWVRADPGGLEQVVVNLVVNARDAMPVGGRLAIAVAAEDIRLPRPDLPGIVPGRYATLAVADTGIGMDEATLAHSFEPFFTTKPAGKGTGLGLATVYGIVSMSSGWIGVDSRPGAGTRFTIYLPLVDAVAGDHGTADGVPGRAGGGSETILLVEDEDAVRAVARRVLEGAGYRVLAARHGAEALELAEVHEGGISLLLSDVIMPGMVGPVLAQQLVARHPGMRVLFMSGHVGDVLRQVGLGGHQLLPKPFTLDSLRDAVRQVLDEAVAGPAPARAPDDEGVALTEISALAS